MLWREFTLSFGKVVDSRGWLTDLLLPSLAGMFMYISSASSFYLRSFSRHYTGHCIVTWMAVDSQMRVRGFFTSLSHVLVMVTKAWRNGGQYDVGMSQERTCFNWAWQMDPQSVQVLLWHSICWWPSETIQLPKSYNWETSKLKLWSEFNCQMISCMNTITIGIHGHLSQAHSLNVRGTDPCRSCGINDLSKWVSKTIQRPHCSGNEENKL